jgi:hypothetical protein
MSRCLQNHTDHAGNVIQSFWNEVIDDVHASFGDHAGSPTALQLSAGPLTSASGECSGLFGDHAGSPTISQLSAGRLTSASGNDEGLGMMFLLAIVFSRV